MTTATAEATETGEKKSKARTFKPDSTPRQRVLSESLAKFVKKNTGLDVSWRTVWAVRWCLSRWQEDPETKALRDDMDEKLKVAELKAKREKLQAALAELEAQEKDLPASDGDSSDEEEDDEPGSDDDTDDDEGDDIFSESESSGTF